jgi:hypothetical protein
LLLLHHTRLLATTSLVIMYAVKVRYMLLQITAAALH